MIELVKRPYLSISKPYWKGWKLEILNNGIIVKCHYSSQGLSGLDYIVRSYRSLFDETLGYLPQVRSESENPEIRS